ncbi:MAG: glycosyltransferase family 4 protein, partial [Myxococcota bacterium]
RYSEHSWGGMETRVLELAKQQQILSKQPRILTSSIYEQPGTDHIQGIEIQRHAYLYPSWGLDQKTRASMDQVGGNLISWPLFYELCKTPKLDLVHAHCTRRLGGLGWLASRLRRVPFVVSLHGDVLTLASAQEQRFQDMAQRGLEWGKAIGWLVRARALLEEADAIIAVGHEEWSALRQHPKISPERVHFVPGGVHFERFSKGYPQTWRQRLQLDAQQKLLVQVGRIDPQKNQMLTLHLLQGLRQCGMAAHLLWIGAVTDEGYQERLQQQIAALRLQDHVHHASVSYQDQALVDAFHAADLMLMPSIHEPFGLTVIEGWCAQKPVVASDLGGLRQLVDDKRDGYRRAVHDPQAWIEACTDLLNQPEKAQKMGQAGFEKVQSQYLWKHVVQNVDHVYAHAHNVLQTRLREEIPLRLWSTLRTWTRGVQLR